MPELPEVETVVRGLRPDVVGRCVMQVAITWPRQVVEPSPDDFCARLVGQRIEGLRRRGKYVVFDLSDDVLLVHLKMTGRLYVASPADETDRWVRATFDLDDGRRLCFSDSRKFGRLYLMPDPSPVFDRLGPEPLEDNFTPEVLRGLLARHSGMVKPLLLNQGFVAGIGNIYADEILWHARIAPRRKVSTLEDEEIERLYRAIRTTLRDGIRYEGASVNWYRKADGSTGDFQSHLKVYDRSGEPCLRCGTPVRKVTLAQRGTHFCPSCQR
jgi:formamidopyrimidine-DNA glycosylase